MASLDPSLRFTLLWTEAAPTVAGFIRGAVCNRADTEDLMQEVAIAAFSGFAAYDTARPFVAWALGIARHKVMDRWRQQASRPVVLRDPELLTILAMRSGEMTDELDDRRQALTECLGAVAGRQWEILHRHYVDGEEPMTIGEKLGVQASHVRTILTRLRQTLRDCIQRRMVGGEIA